MKLFQRFRKQTDKADTKTENEILLSPADPVTTEATTEEPADTKPVTESDNFTEWRRTRTHGGIERIERNDIYEMYYVYGTDSENRLICRCYQLFVIL